MARLLTGLIAGGIWLLVISQHSQRLLFGVILCTALIGLYEYYKISLRPEERGLLPITVAISALPLLAAFPGRIDLIMCGLVLSFVLQSMIVIFRYARLQDPFNLGVKIAFGTLYVGIGASHLFLLSTISYGWYWLLLLSIVICASDTGAYYVGTTWGKTKLCPWVSPGKTVEGLLGGMGSAALAAMLFAMIAAPHINPAKIIILAIFLSGLGVIGDLTESIFKRAHNIKDSGAMLPGHGGILDRVDSILLTAPALYYVVYFVRM